MLNRDGCIQLPGTDSMMSLLLSFILLVSLSGATNKKMHVDDKNCVDKSWKSAMHLS